MREYLLPVDESVERAMREETLDGRRTLMDDLREGRHARAVVAEINHARQIKALGEQSWVDGDFEFRLEGVFHGAGFHAFADQEGTYECWDGNDVTDYMARKHPETRPRLRPRKTTVVVAGKYAGVPPRV